MTIWYDGPKESRAELVQPYDECEHPFGRRLRAARKRREWRQSELAEKVGVSEVTMNRWEKGKAFPQPYSCRILCVVLEISPEELFAEAPEERLCADHIEAPASLVFMQVNRLRQARLQHNLSQLELAQAIGVTRGSINRWEHGLGFPSLRNLQKLCLVLEKSSDELFPNNSSKSRSSILEEAKGVGTYHPSSHRSGQRFFDY